MRLGLLELLQFVAIVFLVPRCTESRIVPEDELREKLGNMLNLSSKHEEYKDLLLSKIIFAVKRTSHLDTGMLKVFGRHKMTAVNPRKDTMTMKTTTRTPPTRPTKATKPSIQPIAKNRQTMTTVPTTTTMTTWPTMPMDSTVKMKPAMTARPTVSKRRRKRELSYDEGSGSGMMSIETILDEGEILFDEEEMLRDDNDFNGEGALMVHGRPKEQSNPQWTHWSLSYYGIFQLTDSHFCESGYRWSRNVCKTNCSAFLDDDIEDDIKCFIESGYWLSFLRHHIY